MRDELQALSPERRGGQDVVLAVRLAEGVLGIREVADELKAEASS